MSAATSILIERDMDGVSTMHTVKQIGDALEIAYPGWMWFIEVKGGIAQIRSMHANPKYGFNLNLVSDHYSASDLKRQALTAGGELLERLNMPRRRADLDLIESAPQSIHGFLEYQR